MESFRSEENHQFTKDAFLITLFDMRNQSGRVVSSLLSNKGKKKQPTFHKVERGCNLDVDVQTIILDGSILDAPHYGLQETKRSSKRMLSAKYYCIVKIGRKSCLNQK
ncbi:hypothetical protein CEXT_145671 [Caerostris extrusa]|uniref:Uncharacterized protein n=1 Tax=Caerostris extrusa TaxID=172846 RepID=A0AAV4W9X9_CAEEX|nr:hypothetical protein CEXT_145671 [Caerostris extrusa]